LVSYFFSKLTNGDCGILAKQGKPLVKTAKEAEIEFYALSFLSIAAFKI